MRVCKVGHARDQLQVPLLVDSAQNNLHPLLGMWKKVSGGVWAWAQCLSTRIWTAFQVWAALEYDDVISGFNVRNWLL